MPEMARMLGTSRQKVYEILNNPRYQHFFEIIEIGGRRRVTRESLQHFLEGQDRYQLAEERKKESGKSVMTIRELPTVTKKVPRNPDQRKRLMLRIALSWNI